MENHIAALHSLAQRIGVGQITGDEFGLEPLDVIASAVGPDQQPQIGALLAKQARHVTPDKSGCSGNKRFHISSQSESSG